MFLVGFRVILDDLIIFNELDRGVPLDLELVCDIRFALAIHHFKNHAITIHQFALV